MTERTPYKRLTDLGEEKLSIIRERLARGESGLKVARLVQDEWGDSKDIPAMSLGRMLTRYRKDIAKELVTALVEVEAGRKGVVQTLHRIDTVDELNRLIVVQKARLEKMLLQEKAMPLLMGVVSEEIQNLKELLKELAKLHLEIGVLRRAPKQIKGVVQTPNGELTEFSWTEEVDKVIGEVLDGQYQVLSH